MAGLKIMELSGSSFYDALTPCIATITSAEKQDSFKKFISAQSIMVGKAAGVARREICIATGYEIAGLSGNKVSSKITHLTWRSAYRKII